MIINDLYSSNGTKFSPNNFVNLSSEQKERIKKMTIELMLKTDNLTKKDIGSWRLAWQQAINVERPIRRNLYDIYTDAEVDLHLTGTIDQRINYTLKKAFRITDKTGKENKNLSDLLESQWFKDFIKLALQTRFWGHSLIEFGDIITTADGKKFDKVSLVPRKHVIPEYGVIIRDQWDDPQKGISYREGDFASWCIEAGGPKDLGLLLKCSPQTISKRNMLAFWDNFGEIFGAPVRIANTTTRDKAELDKIENMMDSMGAMSWGVFPEGTKVEFMETARGDAFNVYDKRIDRANSEMSKGILNQTMTIDSGSSYAQSDVHLEIFENVIEQDADFIKDIINDKLFPFMIMHGFKFEGYKFEWDEAVEYSPEEMKNIEQMLISGGYEIDPKYFIEKYNIPIIGKRQSDFFE